MPLCITCTDFVPYLYTVYESKHNLRLEQCAKCHQFADPYVEHDSLTLVLDLFLFKRGVYWHLLYNRGTKPRHAIGGKNGYPDAVSAPREPAESMWINWLPIIRLGALLVFVDAFIRWSHFHAKQPLQENPWTTETLLSFLRVLVGCIAETIAFHGGIILACYVATTLVDHFRFYWGVPSEARLTAIRSEFRYYLLPLALFYSSLTKLFLLFLLTIWTPATTRTTQIIPTPPDVVFWNDTFWATKLELLERENINREWIIRNALGGMSAGFGLRVILDYHPSITTMIILSGWLAKRGANYLVSQWVGVDETASSAWQAYSIP